MKIFDLFLQRVEIEMNYYESDEKTMDISCL